ncbi:MAG: RNA-binding S4 domain-containing protein [Nitrosomonadales bacterium]|nr:RNA-binding S4 domain-containing protein [Nitrosomonadales bacterium]
MQQLEFQLRGEFVELNQLLKLSGVCDSGGAGKALVAEGVVSVDGVVESRKTAKIRAGQVVTLGDVRIQILSPDETTSHSTKPASGQVAGYRPLAGEG